MSITGFYEEKLAKIKALAEEGIRGEACTTKQADGSWIPTPLDALHEIVRELAE